VSRANALTASHARNAPTIPGSWIASVECARTWRLHRARPSKSASILVARLSRELPVAVDKYTPDGRLPGPNA
jgi:hypothetical protein